MRRILLILMTMTVFPALAQERFDYLMRRNPWNGGENAAGIRQDSVSRSYAEAWFTKENGGLADYSASDNSWNAGAGTASIRHFKKVSFLGHFTYDYFDGRNMSGSMFTRPGYYPVDMLEFTPGRKVRETYDFTGAVAAVLGEHWTGGLKADFQAQNYAKRKDLRHRNTLLDFEFAPGVMWHAGRAAVGVNYIVGKNSDRIKAEQLGQQGVNYYVFLDKGLSYGQRGLWNGSGLHLDESGITQTGSPVREMVQGAGLQVQYGALYVDAAYRHRDGESGEKDAKWHSFDASALTARAVLTLPGVRTHFVRLDLDYLTQDSREYLSDKQTVGGITTTYIYGTTPIFGRRNLSLGGEYELSGRTTDLRAGVSYNLLNRESTLMYPYVRGQRLHYCTVWADALRRFGRWELNVAADFRTGGFSEQSRQMTSVGEPGDYPEQLTDYYDYDNEYLTASRVGATAGVRCNIRRVYVDLSARYEHGFDLHYVAQPNRVRATLRIGYNF